MTAQLDALVFRPATVADAGRLAPVMAAGFETYRAFASDTYVPPDEAEIADTIATRLATPAAWCLLAEQDPDVAGYVAFLPAAEARHPVADPALAHFWMLFVRAPWWGSGLAARLHAAACAEAAARGYRAMRLFTPAGQVRARRFYEREGWTLAAGPYADEDLHLELVEYRRPLAAP